MRHFPATDSHPSKAKHWWRQTGIWRLLLALAIFMTTLYLSYRDIDQANVISSLRMGHHTHSLIKTYDEIDRLKRALRQYTLQDPIRSTTLDDVQLKLEILRGRVQIFQEGEANRELLEREEVGALVERLAVTVESIAPLLADLKPDPYDPRYSLAQSVLAPLRTEFFELGKQFLMNSEVRNEQVIRHYGSSSYWVLGAPAASGLLLLLLFFGQLRQSMRLADSLAAESRKLSHMAAHDSLTGLPNRALLKDRLSQAIHHAHRAQGRFAVIFLDLDRFKAVNDSLGHGAGDELLKTVADRLNACVREGDTVARISGDEFVLLIEDVGPGDDIVNEVAERVAAQLRTPFLIAGQELLVTGSIGISLYPDNGEEAELLLMNADAAMYSSKANGRNGICTYETQMNAGSVSRLELTRDLHHALERNQLQLHFQPSVELASGEIFGVEALLRWQHPSRGLLSPDDFIPLAEESGLIVAIGDWVIATACAQAASWHQQGLAQLKMAVNLSALQLQQPGLTKRVAAALEASGHPAQLLELELTETQLMRDVDAAVAVTQALRELGVSIAIDDFGTGYCSLNDLQRFPVSTLKLDRSLVQHALTKPRAAAIARSVIGLGKSLELEVLAEGIETPEQLAFLRGHQCLSGQGYLFSRPLPAAEIANLLRASQAA